MAESTEAWTVEQKEILTDDWWDSRLAAKMVVKKGLNSDNSWVDPKALLTDISLVSCWADHLGIQSADCLGAWLAVQKVGTTAAHWADWKDEKLVEMWLADSSVMLAELLVQLQVCLLAGVMVDRLES